MKKKTFYEWNGKKITAVKSRECNEVCVFFDDGRCNIGDAIDVPDCVYDYKKPRIYVEVKQKEK